MQDDNKSKAIIGMYWMTFISISNAVIKLIITMILSRLLSPHEFGTVSAVQIVISFADIFWMMGVGPAIIQKKELTDADISTGNILNIIFGLSVYGIIFIFTPIIANFVGIKSYFLLRILSIVFVIHSISGISESLLQREMRFSDIGIISTISLLLYGTISIILAFFRYGVWALVIAQIIQALSKTILSIKKQPIKLSLKLNKSSAKDLMYFGIGFTFSRFFNNIANQGDYFVVNKTLGSTALGIYNRAYQLLLVPTDIIGTVMDKVLFPLLSKYQDKYDKLRYVYLNIIASVALLTFPISITCLIVADDLIYVVLGSSWSNSVTPFKILISCLFFRISYKICDSLVRSLGAVYKRLWIQIFYSFVIIGGAFIGKNWGINGVAMATSISIFINYILMFILTKHLIKLKLKDSVKYILPIAIISLLIGGISYLVALNLVGFMSAITRIIVITSIVVILYNLAVKTFIAKIMPKDFVEFLITVINVSINKIIPIKSIDKK